MSEKNEVAGVFLDLSKAFDSVDHKILLEKLERMGFRGIVHILLKSYLTNRIQYVQVNFNGERYQSRWLQNLKSILKGSILGAFLFTLYMNDLPELTRHFIAIFVDYTSIIVKIKNNDTLEGEIHSRLSYGIIFCGNSVDVDRIFINKGQKPLLQKQAIIFIARYEYELSIQKERYFRNPF
ncbi:hypothetical protein Trydic_g330 [Trypoxylus dichotomus]